MHSIWYFLGLPGRRIQPEYLVKANWRLLASIRDAKEKVKAIGKSDNPLGWIEVDDCRRILQLLQ